MENALKALLDADAALVGMVGTNIVWNHIPQVEGDPGVSLWRISGAPAYTMAGPDDLVGAVVQIDVRALTVSGMWAIRDRIIAVLSGHRGGVFRGIFLRTERQSSDKPENQLFHRCSMDFDVWAIPA